MTPQTMKILQMLRQKNNQPEGASMLPSMGAPQIPQMGGAGGGRPSMLGFLGGLGDTPNAQGGIDPSMMTRMNQIMMKQMGQGNGEQPFPWQQQPMGQQLGQDMMGGGKNLMKLLGLFI